VRHHERLQLVLLTQLKLLLRQRHRPGAEAAQHQVEVRPGDLLIAFVSPFIHRRVHPEANRKLVLHEARLCLLARRALRSGVPGVAGPERSSRKEYHPRLQ